MTTEISKDPIFTQAGGENTVNVNYAFLKKDEPTIFYQRTIEILCDHMKENVEHQNDLLIVPLVDAIKKYISTLTDSEFPEEINENIQRLKQVTDYIDKRIQTDERFDINFDQFSELLKATLNGVFGIQNLNEGDYKERESL